MATGTAILDFGAFPGSGQAAVAVADATVGAASKCEAWIRPIATAEHSEDEHIVEDLKITAGPPSAGVGFTAYGECKNGRLYGTYNVNWATL